MSDIGNKCIFARIGDFITIGDNIKIQILDNKTHRHLTRLRVSAPVQIKITHIKERDHDESSKDS